MIIEAVLYFIYDRSFIYQLFATLLTYFAFKVYHIIQARRRWFKIFSNHRIPGPKPTSWLGGNISEFKNEFFYETDYRLWKQYGEVYGFFVGVEAHLVVTNLDLLKKIFIDDSKFFQDRAEIYIDLPLTQGILFARYPRWKLMRKVLSAPFSLYKMRGSSSTQFIEDSLKLMVNYIDKRLDDADKENVKANIDIHSLMKSTALHLISDLAIKLPDVQVKEDEENVKSLDTFLSKMDKGIAKFSILFPPSRKIIEFISWNFEYGTMLARIHNGLNKIIDDGITRLSKNESITDDGDKSNMVLDALIKMHYEDRLTRAEVLGSADSLLLAGYDTTSTTLTYIFWVLSKYPEIQDKLRGELGIYGVESKYLLQVIKETMRLYPTVFTFTSRLSNSTVKIDNWTIPKGVRVSHNTWLMHNHPDHWPEPRKFDPERFREGIEIHPCVYAPFGIGEKKCLGFQLAMLELKMITCDILMRYRLKLKSPQELVLVTYAIHLSKPSEKVMIELERL